MNAHRDPDRLIHSFLREGAEQLHDQVYDAVRAQIEQKRQRADIGPWRTPIMNRFVVIGLGAAAVVVALIVGTQLLLPRAPGPVGGAPSAEPSATVEPSVAAPSAADGLPQGPFSIVDEAVPNAPLRITVTIPASGWSSKSEFGGLVKGDEADPPEAALLAWSWPAGTRFDVYKDPCKWASTRPEMPATTVDEFIAALAAQTSRDASASTDVTVGGHSGRKIILHVPNDAPTRAEAFKDCDRDTFASYGEAGRSEPLRFHQGPGQVDELWILDVDGAFVVIDAMYRPTTAAELVDEMRAIAESATFEAR